MPANSGEPSENEQELNGDTCVTCKREVKQDDRALHCDLCKVWEHLICIKVCDRPTNESYIALTQSLYRSLIFACMKCRHKGTSAC